VVNESYGGQRKTKGKRENKEKGKSKKSKVKRIKPPIWGVGG